VSEANDQPSDARSASDPSACQRAQRAFNGDQPFLQFKHLIWKRDAAPCRANFYKVESLMLAIRLIRSLIPPAERDEVVADLEAEYRERVGRNGGVAARRWLWLQLIRSIPALLHRTWWRGRTGFDSPVNAMNPGGPSMERWLVELRFALRRLRTRPTYTILAVLTLALGVGGMAAIAGIVRPLVVNPLPYPRDNELVSFWAHFSWEGREVAALRPVWSGFAGVAAYRPQDVTIEVDGGPTRFVPGFAATTELFDVLGVKPRLGRAFAPGEDSPGTSPVAVLSDGLWRELGADASIIGKQLRLNGAPRTIIGVMPPGFWFPDPSARVWTADYIVPTARSGVYSLVGRVAKGQDAMHMQPAIDRVTKFLGSQFTYPPEWDRTKNAVLTPLRTELVGGMKPALFATFAAMAVIMLIACANVAALMLGQVESRSAELALRSALGADRARITAQLVTESLVVGLVAGLVGTVFAIVGFNFLRGALPLGAWSASPSLDWTLFIAAMFVAVVASLLVAMLPAFSVWRSDLRTQLSGSRTGGKISRRGGLQVFMVVGEVAAAVLLACGAGLLMRSVSKLYAIDAGVDVRGVAVVNIATPNMRGGERRIGLLNIAREVSALPGVKAAAVSQKIPLTGHGNSTSLEVSGAPTGAPSSTYFRIASRDYFAAMKIPLKSGRVFDGTERTDTANTMFDIVVNESFVKAYFPNRNPVGQIIGGGFGAPERIVGVVGDVAEGNLTDAASPARYYLMEQIGYVAQSQKLVVRMTRTADAIALLPEIRRVVSKAAPTFAVEEATTMQRILDRAVGPARDVRSLLGMLTGLALLLGAIGIYGVIAQFVARRSVDWSIRVALGLSPAKVVRLVVGHGVWMVVLGIAIGVVGSIALGRFLSSLLFGVTSSDPLTIAGASAALLAIGIIAALIPAVRAGRTDPALVLRKEG
jgi:putative ABC transport system permease protein